MINTQFFLHLQTSILDDIFWKLSLVNFLEPNFEDLMPFLFPEKYTTGPLLLFYNDQVFFLGFSYASI